MEDTRENAACPECADTGVVTVAAHGCGGNEQLCSTLCPVPEQDLCPLACDAVARLLAARPPAPEMEVPF